jgi:hypothetical protein
MKSESNGGSPSVYEIGPGQFVGKHVNLAASSIATGLTVVSVSGDNLEVTGHSMLKYDALRFATGDMAPREFIVVEVVDANNIRVNRTFITGDTPAASDTFDHLRYISETVSSGGATTVNMEFTRDAGQQAVVEDTSTASNNRPLPVIIKNLSNLNNNEVNLGSSIPAGTNNIGDVDIASALPAGTNNIGDVDIASALPAGTNNIGDVDIASAIPAGANSIGTVGLDAGTNNIGDVDIASAIPAGANSIGTVGLDAGTNNIGDVDIASAIPAGANSIGTVGLDAGSNNIGDVDIASAIPAGANSIGTVGIDHLDVVDFMDTSELLDTSSTNIPASATTPVTIVASLAAAVKKIQYYDTTGSFVGLYSDPAGTPVLEAIFGPGTDQTVEVAIPAATVLGLRNMENSTISTGLVAINFLG